MTRAASPFSPRMVVAVVAVGTAAFLLCLYAIGQGWSGRDATSGSGHAASNGLNGYSALVRLLERQGLPVSTSRNRARLDTRSLLVVTPQHDTSPQTLGHLLAARRTEGPTLVILPKYLAADASQIPGSKNVPRGWVQLGGPVSPRWVDKLREYSGLSVGQSRSGRWAGAGRRGSLPRPEAQSIAGPQLATLVGDGRGGALAAFVDDGGFYPTLLPLAGRKVDAAAPRRWALTIVAEPDLMNNQGMADPARAQLAVDLVKAAREDDDLPIVFDLTLPGLGANPNLLTLAFEPPFLAATLCLLLAALLVAWRALRRFGPAIAEAPALSHGKRQLARNGAGLIERSRRLHLLGPPYAALIAARIAAALGVREPPSEARELASARLLERRGLADDYPIRLEALRGAHRPGDLLRAAGALKDIERTLTT